MLNNLFRGVFDAGNQSVISIGSFLLCVLISLVMGGILAVVYGYKSKHSQGFLATLSLLPAVVCIVIMMVNGNVGAGVAVAGAFSLVRFRSVPGTAREIGAIFVAMGAGLMAGMGYLAYAVLFTLILSAVSFCYDRLGLWKRKSDEEKVLHITIPENLDYGKVFDEVMEQFTAAWSLTDVKTTNMGSLFKLTYRVKLKDEASEKEFIDKLRVRNGNLEILLSRQETAVMEL